MAPTLNRTTGPYVGSYESASASAQQTIHLPNGGFETRVVGRDMWSRPTVDGKVGTCWYHYDTGAEDALEAGLVPALTLPLGARARGFLEAGEKQRVVAELSAELAAGAAMPKVTHRLAIEPDATLDGIVTVVDGNYRSVIFRMSDLVAALEESGSAVPKELDALAGWEVSIGYDELGTRPAAVAVGRKETCTIS